MSKNIFKEGPFPALVGVITTLYEGTINAAPFTWFTPCSYDPPLLMVALKEETDTLKNILLNKEFVLQTMPDHYCNEVHQCAKKLPRNVSELDHVDLGYKASSVVSPPRLFGAAQWYECVFVPPVVSMAKSHKCIFGEVVASGSYKNMGRIDVLMHLGENKYARGSTQPQLIPERYKNEEL